ncbi:MAG: ABC transporter permease [Alphaproteobacteria bacterium]|nr:ABC transporter permease [Alphaproteobacteria bacterium]
MLRLLRVLARRRMGAALALVVLVGFALAVLARPVAWPYPPGAQEAGLVLQAPSLAHPLGTDGNGRDVLARVIDGARYAFAVPLAALALAILIGAPLGLAAGLGGGWFDAFLSRIFQGISLVPPLLLAMALVAAMGPSLRHVVFAIGVLEAIVFARAMRDEVRALHERGFVEAATAAGNPLHRLVLVHLLPNTLARIAGEIPRQAAWALGVLAAMGFVGIATAADTTEWGSMIREGVEHLYAGQWWVVVFPGFALLVFGTALRVLAESIDEHGPRRAASGAMLAGVPGQSARALSPRGAA